MKFQPNMGRLHRASYLVLGTGAVVAALLVTSLARREAWALGILGGLAIASGAVGF